MSVRLVPWAPPFSLSTLTTAALLALSALFACGPGASSSGTGGTTTASTGGTGGSAGATTGSGASTSSGATGGATTSGTAGAGGTGGTGGATPSFEYEVITQRHRFIPGQMFGGWGPHLGHLVRAAAAGGPDSLYWVDDVCSQAGGPAPVCDVLHDTAIGVFRRDGQAWTDLGETALPGTIQQNTGTLALGGDLETYGIDVTGHVLERCSFDVATSARSCAALPFALDPYANYIGAAVSPQGYRLVWWTDVMDGGGGSFEFVVDYGGGWNGPRKGGAGGYNDSSYIHIAFRADNTLFTMHTQLVSGLAPNWTFLGATGEGDSAKAEAVTWQVGLTPPPGDEIASTDDIVIDPVTADTHLFARAKSGAAVYYFRPKDGAFSGPLFSIPAAYRLRFSRSPAGLAILYGLAGMGLHYRLSPPGASPGGQPIDWSLLLETPVPLPGGYEDIDAIYPESSVYQTVPVPGIHVAVVGDTRQNEVLHVAIHP